MSIAEIPYKSPTDRRWIQRVVTDTSGKQLVLHDHSHGLYVPDKGQPSLKVADVRFDDCTTLASENGTTPVHAVGHIYPTHLGRSTFQTGLYSAAEGQEEIAVRPVIVLQASRTGSVGDRATAAENIVWLPMKSRDAYMKVSLWLPEFLKLDFETARKLVDIANSGDRADASAYETHYAHLLDVILPGRIEDRLAFRLLCEATKFMKPEGKSEFEGIEIHAPMDIGQWLAPFGKKSEDRNAMDEVAGMIGSGEIKMRAKAVLEAVNSKSHELDSTIDAFLKEVAKPNF